ncbi:MAG: hypothetical protein ACYTCU_02440 [Planctomycetota bacterium]|jgi:hypothetical protein
MRGKILAILALVLLALVVRWLVTKPVVRFTLGPGLELVTSRGVDGFAVREDDGLWRLYDSRSHGADDGLLLPTPVIGRPALQKDGSAYVLTDQGLYWMHGGQNIVPGGEIVQMLSAEDLGPGVRLEGVVNGTEPLLSMPSSGSRGLMVVRGGPITKAMLTPIRDGEGEARVPDGAPILCAVNRRAVAFLGGEGWEAWVLGKSVISKRYVAEGCDSSAAVFTPDATGLIVEGREDGLWLLSLEDGRVDFMAQGDLGISRRVDPAFGFRFEPERLVSANWDLDGWLQIYQTHLGGGGRWAFSVGFMHHYAVATSLDGRFLVYAQADFEERGDDAFDEDLYVFDFARPALPATLIGSRTGGMGRQGPAFIGDGASLVFLADGVTYRSELLTPPED